MLPSRILLFVIFLLSISSPVHAQRIETHRFTLDNGLNVLVIPNHKTPVVAHMVWYRVGAMDEEKGKSGLAHFLEHLMFKGTKHLKEGEFSEILAYYGANENAFTSQDFTVYHQAIASEYLPVAMLLEADRMANLSLEQSAFDKEKQVVLEERSSRIDTQASARFNETLKHTLFGEHPYGISTIGRRQEIEALTLEDAKRFHDCFYAPNNALVVLSGDITPERAKRLTKAYYGEIPARGNLCPSYRPQPLAAVDKHLDQSDPQVGSNRWISIAALPQLRPDGGAIRETLALSVLAMYLGNSETGILEQELITRHKLADSLLISYSPYSRGPATMYLEITPREGVSAEQLARKVTHYITETAEKGPDEATLNRLKTSLKAETIYTQDGVQTIAQLYGLLLSLGLDPGFFNQWPGHVDRLTPSDIRKAAQLLLNSNQKVTGWLTPAS